MDTAPPLVGSSQAMRLLRDQIARVGATEFPVLVHGETGTGKELVARHLHATSLRSHGRFIALNCAALVDGLVESELFGIESGVATGVQGRIGRFERAHQGTLFLDEVADLSLAAQAKLLRALQDFSVERVGSCVPRNVNVRVIAATNRPLTHLMHAGQFRADLYFRLNAIELHIPPLRDRLEDVMLLVDHALRMNALPPYPSVSLDAAVALMAYHWPGNVRELERAVQRALTFCTQREIRVTDLPASVVGPRDDSKAVAPPRSLAASSTRYARLVFERCGQNKRRTCRELDISYHTLQRHLRATN